MLKILTKFPTEPWKAQEKECYVVLILCNKFKWTFILKSFCLKTFSTWHPQQYESPGCSLQLTVLSKSIKVCRNQPSPFFGLKQLPSVMQAAALCGVMLISKGQKIFQMQTFWKSGSNHESDQILLTTSEFSLNVSQHSAESQSSRKCQNLFHWSPESWACQQSRYLNSEEWWKIKTQSDQLEVLVLSLKALCKSAPF